MPFRTRSRSSLPILALPALLVLGCGRSVDTTWREENGLRWRELEVPRRGAAGFTLLDSARTGISFINIASDSLLQHNRILAQGGGVCLGDIDHDGLPDIFLARTEGSNALYRNRGNWRFEDIAERAGVATPDRHSTGCAFADANGDGHLDLILAALGGPNALFVNDGTGQFKEQRDAGLSPSAGSTTVAVADVDGDGWLDLYITNYKAYTALDRMSPQDRAFSHITRELGGTPRQYEVKEAYRTEYKLVDRPDLGGISLQQRADPDFFYRNDGKGGFIREHIGRNRRFLDQQGRQLPEEPEDFGLAAMFVDLNGDRAPDLYVANDFEDPDQFWINDGRGNFRLLPWYAVRSTSNSAMAVDVGDVDRNGHPDLFMVDMLSRDTRRLKTQIATHTEVPKKPGQGNERPQMQRNTLQLNRGDGTFAEIARYAGVGASGWSWSTVFLDVDLDGWEDILVGNGHRWDQMDGDTQYRLRGRNRVDWRRMLFEYPPLPLSNYAFRNRGDLTFEDASSSWHFDLGPDISHGMALADLDGDGDLDVVINRLDSPAALLRNDGTAPRIAVRLKGDAPNTWGIGAKVRVLRGAVPLQQREVISGGLYLSSSDGQLTFGTGKADSVTIEVDWRDGRRSVVRGARPNRLFEISQGTAISTAENSASSVVKTLFEDVSDQLAGHRHVEPYFDDFARQLLLPNSFSQLGPGVAWFDADGNGSEDLLVGAGRTGTLALFRNQGGRLSPTATRFPPAHVDLTTILGWTDGTGGGARTILAGVSSYEMSSMQNALGVPSVVQYSPATGAMTPLVKGDSATVGPLSTADYDGDGRLDLFVGGRIYPRGYPFSPSSRLFRNEGGRLALDVENSKLFAGMGMVSSSLFSDIDGNGWPDLVVAIEWGTIRIFLNEQGRFRAVEMPGLAGLYGRWNGLATGDLDGDGRLDIVATGWGRNAGYQASQARPLFLYPYSTPRGPDVLLAQEDPRLKGIAPLTSFARLGLVLPASTMRLRTFATFADATIEQVLGPRLSMASRLGVTTVDHMAFLNRGDRFEAQSLPVEAQLAPAFYAGIADFNGDGNEDVFLSQNFFATDVETPRYDAGRSLLLVGNGAGVLEPMQGQRSGLMVYGEQRGAAYADFDGDGRLDLAVSQNAAPTRLFRNAGATPGLRVRLVGSSGNPGAVGAQIRLRYGDRAGPVREVQAGSGYWSQNGAVQVLGRAGAPTGLWIRWPGGQEQVVPLAPDQAAITVQSP